MHLFNDFFLSSLSLSLCKQSLTKLHVFEQWTNFNEDDDVEDRGSRRSSGWIAYVCFSLSRCFLGKIHNADTFFSGRALRLDEQTFLSWFGQMATRFNWLLKMTMKLKSLRASYFYCLTRRKKTSTSSHWTTPQRTKMVPDKKSFIALALESIK